MRGDGKAIDDVQQNLVTNTTIHLSIKTRFTKEEVFR